MAAGARRAMVAAGGRLTTLLRTLAGELAPAAGTVTRGPDTRILRVPGGRA